MFSGRNGEQVHWRGQKGQTLWNKVKAVKGLAEAKAVTQARGLTSQPPLIDSSAWFWQGTPNSEHPTPIPCKAYAFVETQGRVNPTAEATHQLCNNLQFPKRESCDGWHFLLPCGMSGKDLLAWQC